MVAMTYGINETTWVQLTHGINQFSLDVAGYTLQVVRRSVADILNVRANILAYLGTERLSDDYVLRPGDCVEFVKPCGRKEAEAADGRLLTVKEAAQELRCSISFIYKLMDAGEISFERRGRRKLPVAGSIAEYRERNRVLAQSQPRPQKSSKQSYQCQRLFQDKRN